MIDGICVVCQFQGSRIQHEVMGLFEELAMCHAHLHAARSGMMAASLLIAVQLVMRPADKASAADVELEPPEYVADKEPSAPNSRTLEILARLKQGSRRSAIAREVGVSVGYVSRLKRNHLKGLELPKAPTRCADRTKRIIELLKSGARVIDVAKEMSVSHGYVSQMKTKYLGEGAGHEC